MRYAFIRDHREEFPVTVQCRVLRVSRSGFYVWLQRPESDRSLENRKIVDAIRAIHKGRKRSYGSPSVHRELMKVLDFRVGRNRVARLMRLHGIRSITAKKFRVTTDSKHSHPVAANLLDRKFSEVAEPNACWVADITYLRTGEGWLYLACVLDLYSRRVVGWSMSRRLKKKIVIDALQMALGRRKPGTELMHHSDRGCQYASGDYRKLMQKHKIRCSMSRKGNCWDNAVMESFFRTLKVEAVYQTRYRTREEARTDIFDYIECFYNTIRIHSALGYLSPVEFEKQSEERAA